MPHQPSLMSRRHLGAIHLISHGATGTLSLSGQSLTFDNRAANAEALTRIGQALSANGDILLYGCNVGQDGAGQVFLDQLAALTGADIAASDDPTGATAFDGDWVLEVQAGQIEVDKAFSRRGFGGL